MPIHADWIVPEWPAPRNISAVVTTRSGGVSRPPYESMNLGLHVGDDPSAVRENRHQLDDLPGAAASPQWLQQVHGTGVIEACDDGREREADASFSRMPGQPCAVMTADCLPVLFCDRFGSEVAAAHAGWRGLLGGVLEATMGAMQSAPGDLLAWLGPAIGPGAFEVGGEVRAAFLDDNDQCSGAFTRSVRDGFWMADLYALASGRLRAAGIAGVHGGGLCTYAEPQRFYSYRRDGQTGRMVSLIWINSDPNQS